MYGERNNIQVMYAVIYCFDLILDYTLNITVYDQGKPPKHMSRLLPIKVIQEMQVFSFILFLQAFLFALSYFLFMIL